MGDSRLALAHKLWWHSRTSTPLNGLAERAGAVWIITDPTDRWIVRARSEDGVEWSASGDKSEIASVRL